MSYPSIITQPGSALRNVEPITQAVSELLDVPRTPAEGKPAESSRPRQAKRRILEIGSGDCTHLKHWSAAWQEVEWWPTGRNGGEIGTIDEILDASRAEGGRLENVEKALELDIGLEDSWDEWERQVRGTVPSQTKGDEEGPASLHGLFEGSLMINIVHCCPSTYPEKVFRHLSASLATPGRRPLLNSKTGWIAAYSPFLADDGSYKSEGDEKFDKEYIRAKDDSLGLRSIKSISEMAERWGFREVSRKEMPRGNKWVVWRVASV